jgi:hypothetical protein
VTDKFHLHPWSDLKSRQPPEWLIPGLIPKSGVTTMFAQPGMGKTFTAIAAACSIGTGRRFVGLEIKQAGPVIFIAAEGEDDLAVRHDAWVKHHRPAGEVAGFYLDEPVNFFDDAQVNAFLQSLGNLRPLLIVIDALADAMQGGDEDRAKDINKVFGNIWRVVHATGAAVLVIHHAGWDPKREKGSIAIRAKSDVVFEVKMESASGKQWLTLICHKNRRGRKFENIKAELVAVPIETSVGEMPVFAVGRRLDDLDLPAVFFAKKEDDAMRIFGQFPNGATSADWRKKIIQTFGKEGWSVPAFDRVTVNLKNAKKVTGGGGKGKLWLPILGCGFPSPLTPKGG